MKYIGARVRDLYLGDTPIENIFINEFMPEAEGDFVKVYMFAKLHAEAGRSISDDKFAKQLGISADRVLQAWDYWEGLGAIKKHFMQDAEGPAFAVEFVSLRDQLYGGEEKDSPEEEEARGGSAFGSEAVATLMRGVETQLGRTLSSSEMQQIISWVEDLKATPELIDMAFKYSISKNKTSMRYISAIVENWVAKGLTTVDKVNSHLEEVDQRFFRYRRVLKALGLTRNPTEAEEALMDEWFDVLGFHMDKVLDACKQTTGISNPNIKYVDRVLRGWKEEAVKEERDPNEEKPVTMAVLNQYYDYLHNKAEKDAAKRLEKIHKELPRIAQIDEKLKELGVKLSRALILNDNSEGAKLNEEMDRMTEDRAIILTDNNYEMDYTDPRYLCDKCSDTGITDVGEQCSCIGQRMVEAAEWQRRRQEEGRK